MSFAEAMKREEKLALVRNASVRSAWEDFYDACSITDVVHCISDYLADFDFGGARVRGKYELGVSACLEEALTRAMSRQETAAALFEPIAHALHHYNLAVERIDSDTKDDLLVAGPRLALAMALLEVE